MELDTYVNRFNLALERVNEVSEISEEVIVALINLHNENKMTVAELSEAFRIPKVIIDLIVAPKEEVE
jgi:hypothetical protein